ncbi:hypothetical protein ACOMHN_020884 [Nucella lapillus]
MLSGGTFIKILLVALAALVAQHVIKITVLMGAFSHFYQHYPGPCKKMENVQPGSEDFYTLPNGLTFITSGFRMQHMGPNMEEYFRRHKIKGRIYLMDFKKVEEGVKELKIASTEKFNADDFYPHGISVWEDKKAGRHVVFVVNHPLEPPAVDRIEKFIFDPDTLELKHHAYYAGEGIKVVNSIQPTGENSFYFTNYQYFTTPLGVMVESIFQLPWTDVVYFNGSGYTTVADGMAGPNGIAMSSDGRFIYVAVCLGRDIRVFRRNQDNSLTLQQIYPVSTVPDNILVDQKTGDLYAGCHPIGHKIMLHLDSPGDYLTPSQVLHFKVKEGNITSVQELFYDHGELISGSTSATIYNRKMLIGSIFNSLVMCDVNVPV